MALPADVSTRTVHGAWVDLTGAPSSGTVTFQPLISRLVDGANHVVLVGDTVKATLDGSGAISVVLPVTDDLDLTGAPFSYLVTVWLAGHDPYSYAINVPTSGSQLELADVTPVVPVTPAGTYVVSVNGHAGIVTLDNITTGVTSVNGLSGVVTLTAASVGADASGAASAAGAAAVQRANHTGTQVAATISDFSAAVASTALLKASNLSDVASPSTARSSLGLGSAAVLTAGAASGAATLDTDTKVPDVQVAPAARRPADHGIAGWTFPVASIQSGGNANYAAVGQIYVARFTLARTTTLTKAWMYITTAPSGTPSTAFLGLYDSGGTLRASTADQGAAWLTTGLKNPSFAASYAAAPGEYYVGILVGALSAGTTMPALCQAPIGGAFTGLANFNLTAGAGGGLLFGTTGSALTALPGTITPASLAVSERAIFFAVA